jgi:hypothetical protein
MEKDGHRKEKLYALKYALWQKEEKMKINFIWWLFVPITNIAGAKTYNRIIKKITSPILLP